MPTFEYTCSSPDETAPYEREETRRKRERLQYCPSLRSLCIRKLVEFPEQMHVLGPTRLLYQEPKSPHQRDLLKELKRSGLRANVRPDVLQQQQNVRWLREQPVLLCNREQEHVDLEKAENYLARLLRGLPALREALPAHHSDLPTRDLQRGTMFLESALSVTLHCRSS